MSKESMVEFQIQEKLYSILQVATKIKQELDMINQLIKRKRQLREIVIHTNEILTTIANIKEVSVKNNLSTNEEENELQSNLKSVISFSAFEKQLEPYSDDI